MPSSLSAKRFELTTLFTPGKSFTPGSFLLDGLSSVCVLFGFSQSPLSFRSRGPDEESEEV